MKHNMASTTDNSICRGILLAALIVIILNVPASAVSQRRMVDQEEPVVTHNPAGEYTSLMIDNMIAEAKTFNFSVIVISRLGLDEQLKYNNRRLHNALRRLIDYYDPGLPKGKVVGAVGERVNGPGRIEFYLQGKLVFVVDFKKNTDFDVDCCGADGWYYPYYRGRPKYEIW